MKYTPTATTPIARSVMEAYRFALYADVLKAPWRLSAPAMIVTWNTVIKSIRVWRILSMGNGWQNDAVPSM